MNPIVSDTDQAYLAETLAKVVKGHPNSLINDLLPRVYAQPEALRDAA